ncbi:MAG: hypothetical protein ACR2P5_03930 [Gammaproteobacteria bacterium]
MEKTKDYQEKSEYLREAIRLVELRLEQQQKSSDENQRKAALLITFCVAVIGYLYAEQPDESGVYLPLALWWTVKVILAVILGAAVFYGLQVVDIKKWGVSGADPAYVDSRFGWDFNQMAEELLDGYKECFDINKGNLEKKVKKLKIARNLGILGITLSLLWIVMERISYIVCFWADK